MVADLTDVMCHHHWNFWYPMFLCYQVRLLNPDSKKCTAKTKICQHCRLLHPPPPLFSFQNSSTSNKNNVIDLSFLGAGEEPCQMSGFWVYSSFLELGDGLINFENSNPSRFFPPLPDGPSKERGVPTDIPGPRDDLVSWHNYPLSVIPCPNPAQTNHESIFEKDNIGKPWVLKRLEKAVSGLGWMCRHSLLPTTSVSCVKGESFKQNKINTAASKQ